MILLNVWPYPLYFLDFRLNVMITIAELVKEVISSWLIGTWTKLPDIFSRGWSNLIWADYGPYYVKVRKVCKVELWGPLKKMKLLVWLSPFSKIELMLVIFFSFLFYSPHQSILLVLYMNALNYSLIRLKKVNNLHTYIFKFIYLSAHGLMRFLAFLNILVVLL